MVDFGSLVSRTKIAGVSVETAATTTDSFIAQSPVTQMSAKPAEICENPVVVKPLDVQISVEAATSDMQMSYEQNSIAPVTPVNQSASLRLLDVPRVCEPDMLRSASPFDSLDKRPNFNKDLVLDIALMDEVTSLSLSPPPPNCYTAVLYELVGRGGWWFSLYIP